MTLLKTISIFILFIFCAFFILYSFYIQEYSITIYFCFLAAILLVISSFNK